VAAGYSAHRPGYPEELYLLLADLAPGRTLAWDCGAGTGQGARGLAAYFQEVLATDASAAQIQAAPAHPGITYRVAPAHASGLADASVDLILVAQALHWFPLDDFYAEVRRVGRPGALLAVLTYNLLRVTPEVDSVLDDLYHQALGPYWPPERRHVDQAYAGLPFPFQELTVPVMAMEANWSLEQLTGFLGTWSALARRRAAGPGDPLSDCLGLLRSAWGSERQRRVTWPLTIKLGRISEPR